jgi:hypoxanthine phosphoribosyltransferase
VLALGLVLLKVLVVDELIDSGNGLEEERKLLLSVSVHVLHFGWLLEKDKVN